MLYSLQYATSIKRKKTLLGHCRIPSDTVPWPYISTAADNVSQLLTSIKLRDCLVIVSILLLT